MNMRASQPESGVSRGAGFGAWLRWFPGIVCASVAAGSASALFLRGMEAVTCARWENGWLLFLLPLVGAGVGWLYKAHGRGAGAGNNGIIREIQEPREGVSARMAPLVLVGTLLTHLCGGSAGREGTAVQMGGSLAAVCARLFKLDTSGVRVLLLSGVAAGFGAVFGTPLAGAVFAVEFTTVGRLEWRFLAPCLVAAFLGDRTCRAFGGAHTQYPVGVPAFGDWGALALLLCKAALAGVVFGLTARLFCAGLRRLGGVFATLVPSEILRPVLGGGLVVALYGIAGTRDYLGLGVSSPDPSAVTILSFFESEVVRPWSWLWKMAFTLVTLAGGFKGGEVTPLFFIGAALGNALSPLLHVPPDLLAALGFVAVFSSAAKTPWAGIVLGVELFGVAPVGCLAAACLTAFRVSGSPGIYSAQRLDGMLPR